MKPASWTGPDNPSFPGELRRALSDEGPKRLYPDEKQALFRWAATLDTPERLRALWEEFPPEWAASLVAHAARCPIPRDLAERVVRDHPQQSDALALRRTLTSEAREYLAEWALRVMEVSAGHMDDPRVRLECAQALGALKALGTTFPELADTVAPRLLEHLRRLDSLHFHLKSAPPEEQLTCWSAELLADWPLSPEHLSEACTRLGHGGPHLAAFLKHPRTPREQCVTTLRLHREGQRTSGGGWERDIISAVEDVLLRTRDERLEWLGKGETERATLLDPFPSEREDVEMLAHLLHLRPFNALCILENSDSQLRRALPREALLPALAHPDPEVRLLGIRLLSELDAEPAPAGTILARSEGSPSPRSR